MSTTVTFENAVTPRVTLTLDEGVYTAVIEVDGVAPQRAVTAEELSLGVRSLDPPTVRIRQRRDPLDTWRDLVDLAQLAVSAAITSTTGTTGGPVGILFTYLRVSIGVRGALRALGEDAV